MWVGPKFKIYLIKEFQRLKANENSRLKLDWNLQRTLEQLVVLSNLESINALLIHQNIPQIERLTILNKTAITQMKSLLESKTIKKLQ
jgi:hypothetical protein